MFKNLVSQHCPQNSNSNLFWDTLYIMKSTCYLHQKIKFQCQKWVNIFTFANIHYSGPMGLTKKGPSLFMTSLIAKHHFFANSFSICCCTPSVNLVETVLLYMSPLQYVHVIMISAVDTDLDQH